MRQELEAVEDVNQAIMNLFYFTDFCVSLQRAHTLRSSEASSPN